jgi:hypothetical protein
VELSEHGTILINWGHQKNTNILQYIGVKSSIIHLFAVLRYLVGISDSI